ncbi:MAG: carboxypeptidase regulatory-like domain-containing protein, partial [Acidobacteria bacterium]|nr:carboxypeptidase regulatory-like domain-containing protein [Acidobacteriota bacterium]
MSFRRVCVSLLSLVLAAGLGWSQEARGTILGRLTDSTGAVIPAVSVRITNVATGVTITVESNDQGNYLAPYLIPGAYRIAAEKTGFKRLEREGIELRVNDRLEVNLALEVGGVTETITVTAETPMLDTASASMGSVVDARR